MRDQSAVFQPAGAVAPATGAAELAPTRHVIRALQIGRRVPRKAAHGVVHSVFRSACTVELDGGTLIGLLTSSAGNLPHGVRCAGSFRWDSALGLYRGQAVTVAAHVLEIPAARLSVDLTRAAPWSGQLGRCRIDARSIDALRALRELIVAHAHDGFAPILLRRPSGRSALQEAMERRLDGCLPRLAAATAALDAVAAAQALLPLIGLGPGLTPSGDDFIVGYLASLWCCCRNEPGTGAFRDRIGSQLEHPATRTTPIACRFILDAVAGEFSERLVDVVRAIANHDDDLEACIARAFRTGHTSGADCLLGLLFGLAPHMTMLAEQASAI